jgi:hypothetical protein
VTIQTASMFLRTNHIPLDKVDSLPIGDVYHLTSEVPFCMELIDGSRLVTNSIKVHLVSRNYRKMFFLPAVTLHNYDGEFLEFDYGNAHYGVHWSLRYTSS